MLIKLKNGQGQWESVPAIKGDQGPQGPQGQAGQDGLTTSITMNGETKTQVGGNIDLGTVITEHQSLANYRTSADQDVIDATKANASDVYTKTEMDSSLLLKQDKNDGSLTTDNKTVVGAINELNTKAHTHTNKSILDSIGSDAEGLYWED